MTVVHSSLTGNELHEPKGAATAGASEIYVADGAASGSWQQLIPHGGVYYSDIGTGTTFTTPTSYALMNAATTTTHLKEFTNNSLGRLTYTGTNNRHVHIVSDISFKHSTGSGQDCYYAIFVNGVEEAGSNVIQTADSANYQQIAIHWDATLSTDDYVEIYLKTASGNIVVHKVYFFIMGMPT